jgi:hypothetical protein
MLCRKCAGLTERAVAAGFPGCFRTQGPLYFCVSRFLHHPFVVRPDRRNIR